MTFSIIILCTSANKDSVSLFLNKKIYYCCI